MDITEKIKQESEKLIETLKKIPYTSHHSHNLNEFFAYNSTFVKFQCTTYRPKQIYLPALTDMIDEKTEEDLGKIGIFTNKKVLHSKTMQKKESRLCILLMPRANMTEDERFEILNQEIIKIRGIIKDYLYLYHDTKHEQSLQSS